MNEKLKFYSLSIDLRKRKCVVVGGGKVALRKVRKLCLAGAEVLVVSPEVLPEFTEEIALQNLTICYEKYHKKFLKNAVLVFASTSDFAVNQQICKDAEELGIWVNSVNGAEYGSFIIPATCNKSILNIGITTEGKAPSLSKEFRKYFQEKMAKIEVDALDEIVTLREKMVASKEKELKEKLVQEITEKTQEIIKKIREK
ncbi:MAG: bifunctional precorrin-2 dehydrogenase/sirohydrochlorin ferrochelatase [Flavobacteriaceae bacterium]|nr:bifunctional precorrin-2 dehydrogenase/sirohydrochlorin ferrochelatase [Flavobacteriaceae bacterium]